MDPQQSTWIERKVHAMIADLTKDGQDEPLDERTAWTFIRYAYGIAYIDGLHERAPAAT